MQVTDQIIILIFKHINIPKTCSGKKLITLKRGGDGEVGRLGDGRLETGRQGAEEMGGWGSDFRIKNSVIRGFI